MTTYCTIPLIWNVWDRQVYRSRKWLSRARGRLSFPGGSDSKESACNAGDPGSTPGSGRCPGEENGHRTSIPVWRTPWTEEPSGLQSMELQRVGHNWVTNPHSLRERPRSGGRGGTANGHGVFLVKGEGNENVLKLTMVISAQLCEYIKNQCIIYFKIIFLKYSWYASCIFYIGELYGIWILSQWNYCLKHQWETRINYIRTWKALLENCDTSKKENKWLNL